jgi:hypothetical protein
MGRNRFHCFDPVIERKWVNREFFMDQEYVEDARRALRLPDFGIQLRIQSAFEELPLAPVGCIANAMYTFATIGFSVLTEVLSLRFHH